MRIGSSGKAPLAASAFDSARSSRHHPKAEASWAARTTEGHTDPVTRRQRDHNTRTASNDASPASRRRHAPRRVAGSCRGGARRRHAGQANTRPGMRALRPRASRRPADAPHPRQHHPRPLRQPGSPELTALGSRAPDCRRARCPGAALVVGGPRLLGPRSSTAPVMRDTSRPARQSVITSAHAGSRAG